MSLDTALLKNFLTYVVNTGGAAALSYFLVEKVKQLATLPSEPKRYTAMTIAATLASLGYGAMVGLSYLDTPAGAQGWLEALFAVAFVAVTGGQTIHARKKLAKQG